MKRFISEYAKYKINSYENNKLMRADVKTEMISNIHKALDLSKKSYISVDEAIRMINENWIKYWIDGKIWKVENNMNKFNEAFNKCDIEFSYNGNLGTLQQKTKDNLKFAEKLEYLEIITPEEYKELYILITDYFKKQLNKVISNPAEYYIN